MRIGQVAVLCKHMTEWCPIVNFDGTYVSIRDDSRNVVQLDPASWNVLVEKIRKGILGTIPEQMP